MGNIYKERIEKLQSALKKEFQAVLVTDLSNIRYLCGYSGSNGALLVGKKSSTFFTDFRYKEQSAKEVGDTAEIIIIKDGLIVDIAKNIKKRKIKKMGIENSMSIGQYFACKEAFGIEMKQVGGLVNTLRQVKSADEIKNFKKAFSIADKAFAELMKVIKPGQTESEVAAHLEFFMKQGGSSYPSFETIIASGPNSACPHAHPTNRKLKKGEMLKIDFGATYNGYHSDMTRTIFLGKATPKFKEIYSIVLNAQKAAIDALKVGVVCKEIDGVARKVITDAGYGECFGHGLGHSLGLEIHESPSLSPTCADKIKPGMAFTVEPGIYLPGWGGIRIEDVYIIKEKGKTRLTATPNELFELK